MEFNIRPTGGRLYKNVKVKEGQTTIDLGLNSPEECMEIAKTLKAAISELLDDDAYQHLMKEEQ